MLKTGQGVPAQNALKMTAEDELRACNMLDMMEA